MKKTLVAISLFAFTACAQRVVDSSDYYSSSTQVANVNAIPVPVTPSIDPNTGEIIPQQPTVGVAKDGDTQIVLGEIQENPNEIVLSSYSQEQQKIDRERYAAEINQIAAERQVVGQVEVPQASAVNVAAFARSTNHAVGTRIFDRPGGGKAFACNKYATSIDAQRAFLEAGGPQVDRLGVDGDGDGFACEFDPSIYRALTY